MGKSTIYFYGHVQVRKLWMFLPGRVRCLDIELYSRQLEIPRFLAGKSSTGDFPLPYYRMLAMKREKKCPWKKKNREFWCRNEFQSMIPMTEKSSPINWNMFSSFPQNRWFEICLFCSTIKMGRWFLMTYICWRGLNHRPFLFKKVSLC